ncbi:MAG: hypothetical protein ACOCQG_01675 [Candidatus Nanoarchaeia archaeon]
MGYSTSSFFIDYYGSESLPGYISEELDSSVEDAELIVDSTDDDNKYGSSCVSYKEEDIVECEDDPDNCDLEDFDTWCFVTISDLGGRENERVDECLEPGNVVIEEPDRCYNEPGPLCNLDGTCDSGSYELKPDQNPVGDNYYHSSDCTISGWDYETDNDKPDCDEDDEYPVCKSGGWVCE